MVQIMTWQGMRLGPAIAVALGLFLAWSSMVSPARAEWRRAESDRFIVYSEQSERDLRQYVQRLETFDRLLRVSLNIGEQTAEPRKFPIYLVKNKTDLMKVYHDAPDNTAGAYMPTGEDIFAVAIRGDGGGGIDGEDVLLHEYTHHFMMQYIPAGYPGWFVEGFAEYYMTAEIRQNSVDVGQASENRAYWVANGNWLPLDYLLGKRPSEIVRSSHQATYYPLAWLLTHWFISDGDRQQQLQTYLGRIKRGEDPVEAMRAATGMDLPQLTRTLGRYSRDPLQYRRVPLATPDVEITVTELPPSANDLLLLAQKLKIGVPTADRSAVAAQVRRLATRYPDDPFAMLTLGHAELHFGDRAQGVAILERLLVLQPDNVEALQYVAAERIREADDSDDPAAVREARRTARALLARAYAVDSENYYTLYLIGKNRESERNYPTDNDMTVWATAFDLAPQWPAIRLARAAALMRAARNDEAIALLEVLANAPHAGPAGETAEQMIQSARAGSAPPSLETLEAGSSTETVPETPASADERVSTTDTTAKEGPASPQG